MKVLIYENPAKHPLVLIADRAGGILKKSKLEELTIARNYDEAHSMLSKGDIDLAIFHVDSEYMRAVEDFKEKYPGVLYAAYCFNLVEGSSERSCSAYIERTLKWLGYDFIVFNNLDKSLKEVVEEARKIVETKT